MQNESEEGKANEPQPDFNREIVFFKSFKEMNDYDHEIMASHSPIERLQNITKFIMDIYKEELSTKMNDLTIHFK